MSQEIEKEELVKAGSPWGGQTFLFLHFFSSLWDLFSYD